MIAVSMLEFLRTGLWGPIRLQMTRSQVQASIGPPDVVSVKREPAIWKYGDVEFHFVQAALVLIHIDHFDPASGLPRTGERMRLDPWVIRQGIAQSALEPHLQAQQLPFREVQRVEPNVAVLRVGAGIQLYFVEQSGAFDPAPGLTALSYFTK